MKKKSLFFKQPGFLLMIMALLTLMLFGLVFVINNTNLSYVPRAQETTDDGKGIDSPGTSGPVANSNDFNCQLSNNSCAEDIPCGYCRQHDSDCRMYLCVGPDYPRPNLPTYGFSVYMPYSSCPEPTKLKSTCSTVVSWEETIETVEEPVEEAIPIENVVETIDGHEAVLFKQSYLMIK